MATLTADINATTREIPTSAGPGFYTIGSENVHLVSEVPRAVPFTDPPTGRMYARRGVGDTTAASHSSGATLTRYDPEAPGAGGGGGGVTVTGITGGSVADATEIQTPGTVKQVSAGVASTGGSVVVSASDPGAIGEGNLWLQVVFGDGNGDGGYGRLWVRNSTDTGWNSGAPMAYGDASTTFVASPNNVGELSLNDANGSTLQDTTSLTLRGGGKSLYLDALGAHVGPDASSPLLITGGADPSAGAGVVAPISSVYLLSTGGVGTFWQKTGAADTAWELVGGSTSTPSLAEVLAVGADPNNIAITGATVDAGFGASLAAYPAQAGGIGGGALASGGQGAAGMAGGSSAILGGNGDGGTFEGGAFEGLPGSDSEDGRVRVYASGSYGNVGDVLRRVTSADFSAIWESITAAAVTDIGDPSIATTEDVANKINELMASLRTVGLLTP